MPRRIVFGFGFWLTAAATAMTIASIVLPRWVRWESGGGTSIHYSYGLHQRCSSITGTCEPFPQYDDCHGDSKSFCAMWRTTGFLMSFAVIIECATLVAYLTVIFGGKQMRDKGWKVVCFLLGLCILVQCASMAVVAYLYDNDSRFFIGWRLDTSWILCTVSWSVQFLTAIGISAAVFVLPEEGGYELIQGDS
ncbi:hypothetical protein NA57DRAFT_75336 [Rhizodiscina lignyota]|uniref:Uncharacterized protein n=1 Tax=Rhizodiscina lignyota TaxID=1504668 RepID=A0A9P4IHN7_9PEZI|nr:hypothetical protein NA57DRAFT_75336 [Rhizodiscina lignyota]